MISKKETEAIRKENDMMKNTVLKKKQRKSIFMKTKY